MTGGPNKVLFDLGGVLFAYNPAWRLTYISEMCGIIESEVQSSVFDTQFDEECEFDKLQLKEPLPLTAFGIHSDDDSYQNGTYHYLVNNEGVENNSLI